MYIAHTAKTKWWMIDFLDSYYYMVIQFIIVYLCLFWWMNLVNCLMVTVFSIFNICIAFRIKSIQSKAKKETICENHDSDTLAVKIDNISITENKFKEEYRKALLNLRRKTWRALFIILMIAILFVYLSEFMMTMKEVHEVKEGTKDKRDIEFFIYYMFLAGVYIDRVESAYGYGIILIILSIESFLLSWNDIKEEAEKHSLKFDEIKCNVEKHQQKFLR